MPLRSSNAGDSIAPHATTTVGASTVRFVIVPSAWVTVASTPVARPSCVRILSAWQPTTTRPPPSEASCSQVFIAERLQPRWQPSRQCPQNSASSSGDALRQIGRWS